MLEIKFLFVQCTFESYKKIPFNLLLVIVLFEIVILLEKGRISSRVAKDILQEMIVKGGEAESIVRERGLEKVTASEQLLPLIQEVIKENPKAVEDYKKGKENAIKFLVGQGMAKTKGSADPKVLEKLIQKILQENNSS